MKPVLFIDVDGVINNRHTTERFQSVCGISPQLCNLLRKVLDETDCDCVISSTWRLDPNFLEHIWLNLGRDIIGGYYKERCRGHTPQIHSRDPFHREKEIQAYLSANPDIEHFAVLDDMDMKELKAHHFQTDDEVGLTEEIADRLIQYLNNFNPKDLN